MAFSLGFTTNDVTTQILQGVDEASSTAKHTLGTVVYTRQGHRLVYCQYSAGTGTVTGTAGIPVGIVAATSNTYPFKVTGDFSDSLSNLCRGVLAATAADTYYVWVVAEGKVSDAAVSTSCASATPMLTWGTTDSVFSNCGTDWGYCAATSSYFPQAFALEDDTAGLADVLLAIKI